MVSAYTTNKSLEKPGNGDYVDFWNVPVNGDMDVIDAALGGATNLNATSGSVALAPSQYQKLILNITGAISAPVIYQIPSGVGGMWIARNSTTDLSGGPWTVTISNGGGGTSIDVVRGKSVMVWSDGTNIRDVSENVATLGTVTSVNVSGGTTGLTSSGGPVTTSGTITLAGTLGVANGGTGAATLTGYVKGSGTSAMTASATVPVGDLSGLGSGVGTWLATPSSSNLASAMTDETGTGLLVFNNTPTLTSPAITGGTINNSVIGGVTPAAGSFSNLSASGTVSGAGFSAYLASPPAIGGTLAAAGTFTTVTDSIGNVRNVPINSQTTSYVLVATDNGKFISITTGGVTVPSGIFSAGNTITIYNNSTSSQTITQGSSTTMYLVGTATTGNRTLAQRGLATILCVASNTFVISGGGLS